MRESVIIGRVGGLAVALGIGAAIVIGCGDAAADADSPGNTTSSGSTDSSAATKPEKKSAAHGSTDPARQRAKRASADSDQISSSKGSRSSVSSHAADADPGEPTTSVGASDAAQDTSATSPRRAATSKNRSKTSVTSLTIATATDLGEPATSAGASVSAAPDTAPTAPRQDGLALLSGVVSSGKSTKKSGYNKKPTISYDPSQNVVNADGTISGRVNAVDAEGDPLKYTAGRPTRRGTVVVDQSGNFTYTPSAVASSTKPGAPTDTFTITVSDAAGKGVHGLLGYFIRGWGSTASVKVTVVAPVVTPPPATIPASAAGTLGWGAPTKSVSFTDAKALDGWWVYDAPGNGGNGRRTPDAISFKDNVMTISGDANGNTGGLMLQAGQMYGAWEVQMKVPVGAKDYNAVALLWPSTDRWPADGEIDFMELKNDATRHNVTSAVHYSPDGTSDAWVSGAVDVDATAWHNYAVVWTPTRISTYVDGKQFFTTTDVAKFPTVAMQLCLQLDYAGSNLAGGAQMQVASAKMYSLAAIQGKAV